MTATDVMAIMGNQNNENGMFGGNYIWIILIFLFFGRDGFGNGGEKAATSADVQRGLDNNAVTNKLNGLENGLADIGFAINNSVKDSGFATQSAINGVSSQLANCCCETNRNIDGIRNDICQQTYQITKSIHDEGEATRSLINANTIQNLRDRVNERDRELQSAQFQISQVAQTSNITGTILDSIGRYVTNPSCPIPCNPCGSYPVVY